MSIYAKNKSMSNCKVGSNQVSRIVFNGKTIWENWKSWSASNSGSWDSYPSSPKDVGISTGSNIRVQYIYAYAEKTYIEGEYGSVSINAYYNGSWHTLASSGSGHTACDCKWSGDLVCSQIVASYGFQVCPSVQVKISASGLKKGS